MGRIILLCLVLTLSGCGLFTKRPAPVPEKVYVTVTEECPVPPELERDPHLPIFDLSEEDKNSPNKVGKAYVLSIQTLQKKYTEALIILDGYRNTDETK